MTALVLGALTLVGSIGLLVLARSAVRNLEERFHASIAIGSAMPCGFGICVRNTTVRFKDAPGLAIEVEKVVLRPAFRREPRSVLFDSAHIAWTGPLNEVEAQADLLAQRLRRAPSTGDTRDVASQQTTFRVTNSTLLWQAAVGGESLRAQGVEVERSGGDIRIFAEQARGALARRTVVLSRGRASLRRERGATRFVSAEAQELHVESIGERDSVIGPGAPSPSASAAALDSAGVRPDRSQAEADRPATPRGAVPTATPGDDEPAASHGRGPKRGRGAGRKGLARGGAAALGADESPSNGQGPGSKAQGAGGNSASEGGALLDRMRVLREAMPRLREALGRFEAVSVEDARVSVDALYLTFVRGGVTVHLGPNAVSAFRTPSSFRLDVTPQATERGPTSLKLGAEVPTDAAAELRVSLTGGPVPLAALGLRKGDLGLLDVEHSLIEADVSMRLTGDGRRASAGVDAKLHDLSLEQRALSSEPVRGAELRLKGDVEFETDGSALTVERGELGIGRVGVAFSGSLRRPGAGWVLRGRVEVPPTSCQAALDALPAGLTPMIAGTRMDGAFSVTTAVDFDSSRPEAADVHFALGNGCKVTKVPEEIDVKRFKGRFRRRVYGPDGTRVEVEMGPGTEGWVPYGAISPFMTAAVLTTEDGGFRHHRGFDAGAIRNSIRDNLREGRFLRGASTITMQTVKNLYLEREKTLGRKIQEAVLTVYLEQALEKEGILELYFNCIEFGPMIYGLGPAAGHYFHSSPRALSLGQALYLSSILPSPKVSHFGPDGRVKAGWMSYLRKLMQIMVKRNLIDEAEMRIGASEVLVFGEPAPEREEGGELDRVDEVSPIRNGP